MGRMEKYLIMNPLDFPILSTIIFLPLLGIALILFIRGEGAIKVTALITSIATLFLSLALYAHFDPQTPLFQFGESLSWIPRYRISYTLGIDGITILLIVLTALITPACVLCSWTAITDRVKEFMICVLLMETAMIGVFCSLDFILFYVFWEAMLIPMYLLIAVWGGPKRDYASIKFFIYTLFGSVFLLVAIIVAVTLTLRRRKDTRGMRPVDQIAVKARDRMRIVKMAAEVEPPVAAAKEGEQP